MMTYCNNFLWERALDTLLISVSSILLDFLFNKLNLTYELFLILSFSLCLSLTLLLPVLLHELFLILSLSLCFAPPVSSSLAEKFQLFIKGLEVYFPLKLYAAFLVSFHVA